MGTLCFVAILIMGLMSSCDDRFILPEEGSLPDETPPQAAFSFSISEGNFMEVNFSNESISSTDYSWDFGDGATSVDQNPTHTFTAEGTYTVTLTSSDKLNVSNTISIDVLIEEPEVPFQPVILNPGFDEEGADSYRDNWRNGDLGGVIQITSSPVHDGVRAAKFPSGGDRIAYQLVTVEEDQDYVISFYYTMKTSPVGSLSIAILGGDVTDPARIEAATIASETFNDQNNADEYVQASISFNSGPNTEVAIYLSNVDVECRFDTFTIAPE